MKIEKGYGINFLVHAISTIDLEFITQILTPPAHSDYQKAEVSQIILEFERVFNEVLSPLDTYFVVNYSLSKSPFFSRYKYSFVANSSGINFSLKFKETKKGNLYIDECREDSFEKQIIVLKFKGYDIDVPF